MPLALILPRGVCVCVCVYLLNCTTTQSDPVILVIFYATRIDPPKGGLCVCVCSLPIINSGRHAACGRITSRGRTGFLIHLPSAVLALIFLARRIPPFLSLVDREVEFCVPTI